MATIARQQESRAHRAGQRDCPEFKITYLVPPGEIIAMRLRRKAEIQKASLAAARRTRRLSAAIGLVTDLDPQVQEALMMGAIVSVHAKMGSNLQYDVAIIARDPEAISGRTVGSADTRAMAKVVAERFNSKRKRRKKGAHTLRFDLESPVTSATLRAIGYAAARDRAGESAAVLKRKFRLDARSLLRKWGQEG